MVTVAVLPVFIHLAAKVSKPIAVVLTLGFAGFLAYSVQATVGRTGEFKEAKALGNKEIITYVAHWNCPSLNSLIACGYRFYRPADKWAGSSSVYLRKRL
jgi:hypothetical protein